MGGLRPPQLAPASDQIAALELGAAPRSARHVTPDSRLLLRSKLNQMQERERGAIASN
jgi:hypothetical protein